MDLRRIAPEMPRRGIGFAQFVGICPTKKPLPRATEEVLSRMAEGEGLTG
jgi:hypothetical protein